MIRTYTKTRRMAENTIEYLNLGLSCSQLNTNATELFSFVSIMIMIFSLFISLSSSKFFKPTSLSEYSFTRLTLLKKELLKLYENILEMQLKCLLMINIIWKFNNKFPCFCDRFGQILTRVKINIYIYS